MKGTHEKLIMLPSGNAFLTGVPDNCDHDDKLSVYLLANGGHLFEDQCRCPTDDETFKFAMKKAEDLGTSINGGGCACSKCRKVLSLSDIAGDAFWE